MPDGLAGDHGALHPRLRYTPDEAAAYRRLWGADPPGYTESAGAEELEWRRVAAHAARHARCYPPLGGGPWRCRAEGPGSDCGTIRDA